MLIISNDCTCHLGWYVRRRTASWKRNFATTDARYDARLNGLLLC